MARKWSVRLLALSALTAAVGCRTAPTYPVVPAPVITAPLLPDGAVPPPVTVNPPIPPISAKPALVPPAVAATPAPAVPSPLPAPTPARLLPKPDDMPASAVVIPRLAQVPDTGPALPDVQPPKDVAGLLVSNVKPSKPGPPAVKPLLVEAPRPPAGPDGFARAARVPAPTGEAAGELPRIVTRPAAPPPVPLPAGQRYGHAPDYRWVAGVLDRHARGGYWTLRYADAGADDPWGGKVRLMEDARLRAFKDGDVVYVEGELVAPPKAAADAPVYPPYRVAEVRRVEAPTASGGR